MRLVSDGNGDGAVTVGDYRRVATDNLDLRAQVDSLAARLGDAEERLGELPTPRQLKTVMEENRELRGMNAILLKRNEVLNRKLKQNGLT